MNNCICLLNFHKPNVKCHTQVNAIQNYKIVIELLHDNDIENQT